MSVDETPSKPVSAPMSRADLARALRLVARTRISEANRRVKLENRTNAVERMAKAQAKRDWRGMKRLVNAVVIYPSTPL